jgi:response regulator RpfG family c-di-GMP phosphodiesterase
MIAALRRIRQGVRAIVSPALHIDYDLASTYLNSEQMTLFRRMQRSEQLHSLSVLRDVLAQGDTPYDLAVAALLHDVGKLNHPLRIWQKTLVVLVRRLRPQVHQNWSNGNIQNLFKRASIVAEHHPKWSAAIMTKTSASDETLWLIAHHADEATCWRTHPSYEALVRLQKADDAN